MLSPRTAQIASQSVLIFNAMREVFTESSGAVKAPGGRHPGLVGGTDNVAGRDAAPSSLTILCMHGDNGSRRLCDRLFDGAAAACMRARRYEIVGSSDRRPAAPCACHAPPAEIRTIPIPVPYSIVISSDTAPLLVDSDHEQILRVHDARAYGYITRLFELIWNVADATRDDGDRVPDHLAIVLDQLARGKDGNAVCRAARLSRRTYTRRVAELQELLNAGNAFQAGVEAAYRGWV